MLYRTDKDLDLKSGIHISQPHTDQFAFFHYRKLDQLHSSLYKRLNLAGIRE